MLNHISNKEMESKPTIKFMSGSLKYGALGVVYEQRIFEH